MSDSIRFEIVTPVKAVYSEVVRSVVLPTERGEIEVLPGHQALLALIEHGTALAQTATGTTTPFVVERGYVEVLDDKVTLLVAGCKAAGEVDLGVAQAALAEGEKLLTGDGELTKEARARAQEAYVQARAEVAFAERFPQA